MLSVGLEELCHGGLVTLEVIVFFVFVILC